jgi:hypothetical protein
MKPLHRGRGYAVLTATSHAMQQSPHAAPGSCGTDHRRPRLGGLRMMRVYHVPGSRSTRVLWMLEEIGVPHELTVMTREDRKTADHISRHPLGRVPVVEFDDGRRLFESAAICIQLADLHPEAGLIPPVGSPDRGHVCQWCFFAMTELEPPIFQWMQARPRGDRPDRAIAAPPGRCGCPRHSARRSRLAPWGLRRRRCDLRWRRRYHPSRRTHPRARTGSRLRRSGALTSRQSARCQPNRASAVIGL